MTTYITVQDVDALLPMGWQGSGDKDVAVMQANTWLTARGVIAGNPIEDDILQAGALLAREAAQDKLYSDSEGAIKRKRVKADTVESEKEYMDGSKPVSGILSLVMDLLKPFLPKGGGSNFKVKRG